MSKTSLVIAWASSLALFGSMGCGGVGVITFDPANGGPPGGPAKSFASYDIDCTDSFEASGGSTALGNAAGTYGIACTYQGKPIDDSFVILGVFHAAPMAAGKWNVYQTKVTSKAQSKGCPGVAIRKSEPTKNQQGEAIGAFCVTKKT